MSSARGGRRGRKRAEHVEEHENHERWLVSYADMMTLLMVLFIVMFAISAVDSQKFAQLKSGLTAGFGGESVAFTEHGEQVQEQNDATPFDVAAKVGQPQQDDSAATDKELEQAVAKADRARQSGMAKRAEAEVENFEETQRRILEALTKEGLAGSVRFSIDERGLVVTIVTSSVVFGGDRAELLASGRSILDAVGPSLAPLPNKIQVDGHTNQLPIDPVNYPSGWELSSARASGVVRYLHDRHGVPEIRLSAAGYADTRPLYPVEDPRAVTMNRRVEVVILSTLPASERALLPSAAGNQPTD